MGSFHEVQISAVFKIECQFTKKIPVKFCSTQTEIVIIDCTVIHWLSSWLSINPFTYTDIPQEVSIS